MDTAGSLRTPLPRVHPHQSWYHICGKSGCAGL